PVHEIGVEWHHDHDSRVRVARDGAAMLLAVPRIRRTVGRAARSAQPDTSPGRSPGRPPNR
ncbi:MAG TPA: hypothetical protein VF152_04790, partial [Acidimicrobiia bacterium]